MQNLQAEKAGWMIRKLLKLVFFLAVIGFAGLAGYAWFGDLSPASEDNSLTVTLDGN